MQIFHVASDPRNFHQARARRRSRIRKIRPIKFLVGLVLAASQLLSQDTGRAPINKQLPSWLTLGVQTRFRFERPQGIGFDPADDDAYVLSRFRLNARIKPHDQFMLFLEGQDSRVAGIQADAPRPNFTNAFDLRQAYVVFGNDDKGWWDVKLGRQEILLGSERLVGVNQWSNFPRTFDAAKLALHSNKNRVDAFSSSVVEIDSTGFDKRRDGHNLHGVYASLGSVLPRLTIEPHVFYQTIPQVADERGRRAEAKIHTIGLRLITPPDLRWKYEMELDWQFGSLGSDEHEAFAGLWRFGYMFPEKQYKPGLLLEYNFASGDAGPGDGKIGTFEQLFPRPHPRWGIADQLGGRNLKNLKMGMHAQARGTLRIDLDYHFFWLASRRDGLYGTNGRLTVPAPARGATSSAIGTELDLQILYSAREDLDLGAGIGWLFPGQFLKQNTAGGGYIYPYLFLLFSM